MKSSKFCKQGQKRVKRGETSFPQRGLEAASSQLAAGTAYHQDADRLSASSLLRSFSRPSSDSFILLSSGTF